MISYTLPLPKKIDVFDGLKEFIPTETRPGTTSATATRTVVENGGYKTVA